MGPVGAYYPEGFAPTKIYVTDEYCRAVPGGTGDCKAGANYAASLYASEIAKKMGYTQVLWLDAVERKYVEEVGTSNMFFVIGDELITSPLIGSILPGITRDSVIQLARSWGMKVAERRVSMDEVMEAIAAGHPEGGLRLGNGGRRFAGRPDLLPRQGIPDRRRQDGPVDGKALQRDSSRSSTARRKTPSAGGSKLPTDRPSPSEFSVDPGTCKGNPQRCGKGCG